MRLIADSGSTKTSWYLVDSKVVKIVYSDGYNPYYWTAESIEQNIKETVLPQLNSGTIEQLNFYGAGCANATMKAVLQKALTTCFPNVQLGLEDDLMAAARATAGRNVGICCILGTGANSCYYDGRAVVDKIPALGYVLGDEGAGTYIGRALIQAYFYREMPKDLAEKMTERFDMNRHHIITQVLNGDRPNTYLASFVLFAAEEQQHPFIQQLVHSCLNSFVTRHVLKYASASLVPIHFVGSVAFGFQVLLEEVLVQHNLSVGKILKSPFPALLSY